MPEVYRPRHPERTELYRLFERDFDRFTSAYEERFEPRHGPLRACRAARRARVPRVRPSRGRLRPDPLPVMPGRAPAGLQLPDPQLLPELPGEARRAVRGEAGRRDPRRRSAPACRVHRAKGDPRTLRARAPPSVDPDRAARTAAPRSCCARWSTTQRRGSGRSLRSRPSAATPRTSIPTCTR